MLYNSMVKHRERNLLIIILIASIVIVVLIIVKTLSNKVGLRLL